jgi:hypothetical protein
VSDKRGSQKDAAAVLRCFRRGDIEGMALLLEPYKPDLSPILAATLLLCRSIVTVMASGIAQDADAMLDSWVAADPDPYRTTAAELVSSSAGRPSPGKAPTGELHFALLDLASHLNEVMAEHTHEDADELIEGYLLSLAEREDDGS